MSPKESRGGAPPSEMPLCREPWESFYILRRGILPCCFGGTVLAPMDGYAEAWNSPVLQEIRSYLARGELSPYCLLSPGCPIVQRVRAGQAAGKASPIPVGRGGRGSAGASGGLLRRLVGRIRKIRGHGKSRG